MPKICICDREDDGFSFAKECCICGGYFHPRCVGTSKHAMEQSRVYNCPQCVKARHLYKKVKIMYGFTIINDDLRRLEESKEIGDNLINLTLTHITKDMNHLHLMDSFFFSSLLALRSERRRCLAVKKFTKNVNIFTKDYVIIPINKRGNDSDHWYLIILQNIGNKFCILIFDSLHHASYEKEVSALKVYLEKEWQNKCCYFKSFNDIEVVIGKCPRQMDGTSCGIHLIHNAMQFLRHPSHILHYNNEAIQQKRRAILKFLKDEIATFV